MKISMSIPDHLRVYIGGFGSPSYSLEKSGDRLIYKADDWEKGPIEKIISPTEDQWQTFRKALDEIGVWQWKARYENPHVSDGTQWELKIHWDGKKKRCYGSNSYPLGDGRPSGEPDSLQAFEQFLNAVRILIGSLPFR